MLKSLTRLGIEEFGGIHDTDDPESTGRSASAGCVRLANWDIVRFLQKIDKDVPVKVE